MVRHLDNLDVNSVGRATGDAESASREYIGIFGVEFLAMAMTL